MLGREINVNSVENKVYGTVNRTWTPFVVDTGGCICIISKSLYDKLQYQKGLMGTKHCLAGLGDGGDITNYGSINLDVNIGPFKGKYRFDVIDHPRTIAILGANFFKAFDGHIDYTRDLMILGEHEIPMEVTVRQDSESESEAEVHDETVVRLLEDLHIPPKHAINCLVRADIQLDSYEGLLIEPYESFQNNFGVISPRVLVNQLSSEGDFMLSILNIDNQPKILPKDSSVGIISIVDSCEDPVHLYDENSNPTEDFQHLDKISLGKHLSQPELDDIRTFLENYSDVFSKDEYDLGRTNLIPYEIDTGDAVPIKQRVRRVAPHRREAFKEKLDSFIKKGLLVPSVSPWASPVVIVPKANGAGIRIVCDYRLLNKYVRGNAYPLPEPKKVLEILNNASIFSSLDLNSGYHQVELHPRDRFRTAVATELGLYEWSVLPQGLTTSPAIFQRIIDCVLAGLTFESCLTFIDDVLVFGKDLLDHKQKLGVVFDRLRQANLKLKPEKCSLFQEEVVYLGHIVNKYGIGTDPSKIRAVKEWKTPTCLKEVRSFLGLCSYYRSFVKDFAHHAAPLHNLLRKDVRFVWNPECQIAFDYLKDQLIHSPILQYPDVHREFILDVDASKFAIGAVLSQKFEDGEKPVAYASRTLTKAERNYTVTRRELLSVVEFTNYFRQYLLGKPFLVRTDHGSLRWLTNFKDPEGQLARWIERLSEFNFRLEYRPGSKHKNADALSRSWCPDCQGDSFLKKIISDTEVSFVQSRVGDSYSTDVDTEIGKSLSYNLRHNKDLPLDQQGFIPIQDLMLNSSLIKYHTDEILNVAEHNERFEIQDINGDCCVRALYGHSRHIPELYADQRDVYIPPTLVHLTSRKAWDNIKIQGIKRMGRDCIHMMEDNVQNRQWDIKDVVIYLDTVSMINMGIDIKKAASHTYLSNRDIPVECISKAVINPNRAHLPMYYNQLETNKDMLRKAQESDPHIGLIYKAMTTTGVRPDRSEIEGGSRELRSYWTQWDSLKIQDGVLYREFHIPKSRRIKNQILVPTKDRYKIWEALHADRIGGGHYGIQKTLDKVRDKYYWYSVTRDIDIWGKACLSCQRVKNPVQHHRAPLHPIPVGFPNERLHMDIVDPKVHTRRNSRYILTLEDSFTKWFECYPLKSMKSEEIVDVLIKQYICRFGVPLQIHTDMGANFESRLFQELGRRLGFNKTHTTYAAPWSDGLIERSHRVLVSMLKQYVDKHGRDWDEALPYISMSYRCTVHESTGFTPNLLMLGKEINLPIHIIYGTVDEERRSAGAYLASLLQLMEESFQTVRENIKGAQKHYKESYDKRIHGPGYKEGDKVWIYLPFPRPGFPAKFHRKWEGPYVIDKKINEQTYVVQSVHPLEPGKTKVVHYNKLKEYVELARDITEIGESSHSSSSSSDGNGSYRLRRDILRQVPSHSQSNSSHTRVTGSNNTRVSTQVPTASTPASGSVRSSQPNFSGSPIDHVPSGDASVRQSPQVSSGAASNISSRGSFWPSSNSQSPFEGFSRSSHSNSVVQPNESFWPSAASQSAFEGFSSVHTPYSGISSSSSSNSPYVTCRSSFSGESRLDDSMEVHVGDREGSTSNNTRMLPPGARVTRYGRTSVPPVRYQSHM